MLRCLVDSLTFLGCNHQPVATTRKVCDNQLIRSKQMVKTETVHGTPINNLWSKQGVSVDFPMDQLCISNSSDPTGATRRGTSLHSVRPRWATDTSLGSCHFPGVAVSEDVFHLNAYINGRVTATNFDS